MSEFDWKERALLEHIQDLLSEKAQFIEIGSGNGSCAVYLKTCFPSVQVLAVEALGSAYADLERLCKVHGVNAMRAIISSETSTPVAVGFVDISNAITLDDLTSEIQNIDLLKISTKNLGRDAIRAAQGCLAKTSLLLMPVSIAGSTAEALQEQTDQMGFPFIYCWMDGSALIQVDQSKDFAGVLEGAYGDCTLVLSRAPIPALTLQGYLFRMLRQARAQHAEIQAILRDQR
ncbi:hypothetical protein RMR10_004730 [Agrobacterium rosae]|uniref:hypothetical protein n=1 Tax=Agrobacterium rosae TaxID=1972867 RepID=UPI002A0E8346|nr:hypothetical protein [Agrobacterium rosae]MDX8315572.1 hypothetical protein [Agrobacterium rosae]